MNKFIVLGFVLFNCLVTLAQAPDRISYQAIVRNFDNTALSNTQIALKIVLLQQSLSGSSVYEEVHQPTTSSNGVVSIEIGEGINLKGEFSTIDWSNGPYFIQTLVDISGGTSYQLNGASQLLSVPYALHAKTAERISNSSEFALKAKVVSLTQSRSISASDIGNTIECSTTSTLTLNENFSSMQTGDVINLEAHNGAKLTIKASSGVQLNYVVTGTALFESFTGTVRFGLLRKIGDNAYIISGQ